MLGGQMEMQWVILHAIELYTDDTIQHVQIKKYIWKHFLLNTFPSFDWEFSSVSPFGKQIIKGTRER